MARHRFHATAERWIRHQDLHVSMSDPTKSVSGPDIIWRFLGLPRYWSCVTRRKTRHRAALETALLNSIFSHIHLGHNRNWSHICCSAEP
jgi:hypothetical protein